MSDAVSGDTGEDFDLSGEVDAEDVNQLLAAAAATRCLALASLSCEAMSESNFFSRVRRYAGQFLISCLDLFAIVVRR